MKNDLERKYMRTVVKLKLQPLVLDCYTHDTLTHNKKKILLL